ncbi:MAG: O-antigen ligase family protein [Halomonas sp.]|nr:O-antigen ligase family protein [Halomonas sp.]MCC5881582.1 O-antigen ligase family protein [Halomonas sp.]
MIVYSNLAVALFGVLIITMSTAHIALLLAAAMGGLLLVRRWPALFQQMDDLLLLFSLSFFGLVFMAMGKWHGELDAMVRLVWPTLLVLPIMALLFFWPPRLMWLWGGVACGAIFAGAWVFIQPMIAGQGTASHSFTADAILLGNISLLLCLMSLAGLGWATQAYRRRTWMVLLSFAAISGLLGALVSGVWASLLVLPFALTVLHWGYHRDLSRRGWGALLTAITLLVAVFLLPSYTEQSAHQATMSVSNKIADDDAEQDIVVSDSFLLSTPKLVIWQLAGELILEKPVQGVGDKGFQEKMQSRFGHVYSQPNEPHQLQHAHNDLLDAWTKRGLPGVAGMLLLYLVPFVLFTPSLFESDPSRRSIAMAGVLMSLAYIGFGLTYTFMTHPLALTVYMFWLIALWTSLRCRPAPSGSAAPRAELNSVTG